MIKLFHAINFIHSKGIVHRDLKPDNLLLSSKDENAEIKIIDFGLSRKYVESGELMHSRVGTPLYVAPEVLRGK